MGMLNANGVVVQVSLFLVTTCFAKYHPETAVVLFVLGRDQHAVLIVRERAFVQSGWESLLFLSSSANAWFLRPLKVFFNHSEFLYFIYGVQFRGQVYKFDTTNCTMYS
ncbi:hypothetical protein CsSME_00007023 [Camellia sinensis var. sinensis]